MRKIILSMVMLMATCLAFAQDASYLIKQYRKLDGAKYENYTKKAKKMAKKEKYTNPKLFDLAERKEANRIDSILRHIQHIKHRQNLSRYKIRGIRTYNPISHFGKETDSTSVPVLNMLTQLTECCPFFVLLNTLCLGTGIADIMVQAYSAWRRTCKIKTHII